MANSILTPSMITREIMMILENNLTFTKHVDRMYDDRFASSGGKIGASLQLRRPARYTVSTGAALAIQDFTDTQTTLTIDTQAHVDTNFTSQELTLSIEDFSQRVLAPKVAALANKVDFDGLGRYYEIWNQVGTPGTTPNAASFPLAVGQRLDEEAAPRDDSRALFLNPAANASIVDALKGLFHSSTEVARQYREGNMGLAFGLKMSMDQNVNTHQVGPLGGTPLVNGAGQGLTSGWAETGTLVTDGWTAAAALRLRRGDVFTIANVLAVNPQNRTSTGVLRQFTVQSDSSSDGAGNLTIPIAPAIITAGPFQNVNSVPADNAALTVAGTANVFYPINMGCHRDAFTLATVDLEDVSQYGAWGGRRVYKGISMRVARQYRVGTDDVPCRIDILYGWKAKYRELGCRLIG